MQKNSSKNFSSFLISHLKQSPYLSLVAIALFWALETAIRPWCLKLLIDSSHILLPISLYLLCEISITLSFRVYDFIHLQCIPELQARITEQLTSLAQSQPHSFFLSNPGGMIAQHIKEVATGAKDFLKTSHLFFSHSLILLLACIITAIIYPLLSLILFSWTILFLFVSLKLSKKCFEKSKLSSVAHRNTLHYLVDLFTNITPVHLFARASHESHLLDRYLKTQVAEDKTLESSHLKIRAFQRFSVIFMIILLMSALAYAHGQGLATVGDFVLVLSLSARISMAVSNLSDEWTLLSEIIGKAEHAFHGLYRDQAVPKPKGSLAIAQGTIVFEDVTFSYGSQPLFERLFLEIRGGEKIGIVGSSGSGKSSLAKLILGLYQPQGGKIKIDGQPISEISEESLHEHIAYVPQELSLFHRTVRENIAYGSLRASVEEVLVACRMACADSFIEKLPQGLDTVIGERGIALSEGQKQRILIARALLKNAPILILDEASSALDLETERQIQDNLYPFMKNKTVIVIAHRLTALSRMDQIFKFEGGRLQKYAIPPLPEPQLR